MEDDLIRLVRFGRCKLEEVKNYANSLKNLAQSVYSKKEVNRAANYFKVLSDPIRLRIIGMLFKRSLCVCELKVALGISQPTISYHIGLLERAGIIEKEKQGKWTILRLKDREVEKMLMKAMKAHR